MASTEERHCYHCGAFHLRNISFFAYWTKCKDCETHLCPRCSGYNNPRLTQFTFLGYMLISFIYYFGIFLIITPSIEEGIDLLFSYSLAGLLLFLPFIGLLLIVQSVIRRLSKQIESPIANCPKCKGSMRVMYHDIFLYFWFYLIHTLTIITILNEIGIIFYKMDLYLRMHGGFAPSIILVFILTGTIIPIIWLFKRIGGRLMPGYKTNTRAWLGELSAVFIFLSVNVILILFIGILSASLPLPFLSNDANISFNLFYTFTSVIFWYFPAFLIGSVFYRLAQKYLLNVNKSRSAHVLTAILFIIIPFYLWGLLSFSLGLYKATGFATGMPEALMPFYSTLFNEIIPFFIVAFLLGLGIISILRRYCFNSNTIKQNSLVKILIFISISFFTGFLLTENIFYLATDSLLLDTFSSSIISFILMTFLIGVFIILFYEIFYNWTSPTTRWGKSLETRVGSLLYPVILGFIFIALSLSFSIIVLTSSSIAIIPDRVVLIDLHILKAIFLISFISGVLIGLKKSSSNYFIRSVK